MQSSFKCWLLSLVKSLLLLGASKGRSTPTSYGSLTNIKMLSQQKSLCGHFHMDFKQVTFVTGVS